MNIRSALSVSFLLRLVFIMAMFMLLFIIGISFKHTDSLSKSSEFLVHSYKIQLELEQLLSTIKDAESGQRGFIINNDSIFLKPYKNGLKKVNALFESLKVMTASQVQQRANLEDLRHLINMRFTYLTNSLALISVAGGNQLLGENMLKGNAKMDSIRLQINKMADLEISSFKKHQEKYNKEISFTPLITLLMLLFSVLVFILAFIKINKDLTVLKNSNEKLLISTESIKHAEKIGEFCTSIWDLKTNKIFFSDNLYRLLGCEPHSFEPTLENYLKFVHPEDRKIVGVNIEDILDKHSTYPRYYRIIRKDGQERYFKAVGKFIAEDSENNMHLNVMEDITKQHWNSLNLKERNRELEQSNKELAYFNQVASHDLQEPLRKIQTIISIIKEREFTNMTETGMDYFIRIQTSVSRMRKLIDDLLLFSRTNKIDKTFEQSDLNLILNNTLLELSALIEEKNAVIQSDQLPLLKVIPFQINQLFQNLLSNSLKYSKPDIAPVIKVEYERILADDYPALKINANKIYGKITLTDNGIGFEQHYAEQIFDVFKRLHTFSKYQGTGIGLSICKKIVENHSGYIFAEGKPGIGAVFTIFLPAE